MSVLDLPIEKQQAIAREMGMEHAAWVDRMKASGAAMKQALKDVKPLQLSPEQAEQLSRKIDSGNPPGH